MKTKLAISLLTGLLTGTIIFLIVMALGSTGPTCVSGHYEYIPESQYNPITKSVQIAIVPMWICDVYQTDTPKGK